MKIFGFLLALASFTLNLSAQIVQGKILDAKTRDPIAQAAVYFNGTFLGTSSNESGAFRLDASTFPSMPLTVSAVGYYSYEISDVREAKELIVFLQAKVYEIGEVEIYKRTNKKDRKKNLKVFHREFLGSSSNGRRCKILNEEDIFFFSNPEKDTLRAFAMEPIQIHNEALGYQVLYYLDEFEYASREHTLFFNGNILFAEDHTSLRRFTERKRRNAYRGSRMHFFRALWADDLGSTYFTINDQNKQLLSYEEIVFSNDSLTKFLHYPGGLIIYYASTWSRINFQEDYAYFARDGYFDATSIGWVGQLSRKRIGDQLPYEYHPED